MAVVTSRRRLELRHDPDSDRPEVTALT